MTMDYKSVLHMYFLIALHSMSKDFFEVICILYYTSDFPNLWYIDQLYNFWKNIFSTKWFSLTQSFIDQDTIENLVWSCLLKFSLSWNIFIVGSSYITTQTFCNWTGSLYRGFEIWNRSGCCLYFTLPS